MCVYVCGGGERTSRLMKELQTSDYCFPFEASGLKKLLGQDRKESTLSLCWPTSLFSPGLSCPCVRPLYEKVEGSTTQTAHFPPLSLYEARAEKAKGELRQGKLYLEERARWDT